MRLRLPSRKKLVFILVIVGMLTVIQYTWNYSKKNTCINVMHHHWNTNITDVNCSPVPTSSSLPRCPIVPPGLLGRQKVNTSIPPTWEEVERDVPQVMVGGRWKPTDCMANQTVAIVIPYMDREENLRVFLRHMHPFLQRQQLHYGIYVVEQNGEPRFNRAILLNIGFLEAQKSFAYECFIQHDVDKLPEDDHNSYRCGKRPKHLTVAIDYNDYKLVYYNSHRCGKRPKHLTVDATDYNH